MHMAHHACARGELCAMTSALGSRNKAVALLQAVLFLMKRDFYPSQALLDSGGLCKLTDLKTLYTVFERC